MILDLNQFIRQGRPVWSELEAFMGRLDNDPDLELELAEVKRLHYLYQRTSSDLARLTGFSARQDVQVYLEGLVGSAYAVIHKDQRQTGKIRVFNWFFNTFPQAFRRQVNAFWLALALMLVGAAFGAASLSLDREAKAALMPFSHLMEDPDQRVAREESHKADHLAGRKTTFASQLIANNTRVAVFALSLGITWGVGTLLVLFSNGVFLGATMADYVAAQQSTFMAGWLLPHGSIEIPAILVAGQAGFVLARAVMGIGQPLSFKTRMRLVSNDLFTLMAGVCLMLIWAGIVESFFSQYHAPMIPYRLKIAFGAFQSVLLVAFFCLAGRRSGNTGRSS